jgi:hypothetical protein
MINATCPYQFDDYNEIVNIKHSLLFITFFYNFDFLFTVIIGLILSVVMANLSTDLSTEGCKYFEEKDRSCFFCSKVSHRKKKITIRVVAGLMLIACLTTVSYSIYTLFSQNYELFTINRQKEKKSLYLE